jgi:SNF2 family DNA or RNA helicase
LYENKINGILADDMGMGKTIQTIAIMAYIYEKGDRNLPHLIIAPKSTIPNWMREFKKWAPFFEVIQLRPSEEFRYEAYKEMRKSTFDVIVTTYEALKICKSKLLN